MGNLYLIPFKYEPLVKVGKADWVLPRWRRLGLERLNPERACVLYSRDDELIDLLEKTLLRTFARFRRRPDPPLNDDRSNGDTEVFDNDAYPDLLMIVWSFANASDTSLEWVLIPDDMVRWFEFYQTNPHALPLLLATQAYARAKNPGLGVPA